jgi:hypothetical protein
MTPRLFLASLLLLACGGTTADTSEFVGIWHATSREFINLANPTQKVEVIAAGWTYDLTLLSCGSYSEVSTPSGGSAVSRSGVWDASVDVFTLSWGGEYSGEAQFDYSLTNGTLTMSGGSGTYDFDGDGTPDEATVTMVLTRI